MGFLICHILNEIKEGESSPNFFKQQKSNRYKIALKIFLFLHYPLSAPLDLLLEVFGTF
jgi:hypothetical protein